MAEQPETYEQWLERTAPPPRPLWSRRKRLVVAGAVLVLGLLFAVPGSDHAVAATLFVVFIALSVGMGDEVARWLQILVLLPLGSLAIAWSEPDRVDWIGYGAIALGVIGLEAFTRWRAKRR